MDTYRAFLAIIISFVILLGYQYFFVGFDQQPVQQQETTAQQVAPSGESVQLDTTSQPSEIQKVVSQPPVQAIETIPAYDRQPKEIVVETDLYTAVLSEGGGTIKSFVLRKHKETNTKDSPGMELVRTDSAQGLPLQFSWGDLVGKHTLYESNKTEVQLSESNQSGEVRLVADAGNNIVVERVYRFSNTSYLIDLSVTVKNSSSTVLQGVPQLHLVNSRFEGVSSPASRFLFGGPAAYINNELKEIKVDEFEDGPKTLQGSIDWAGYEGNYFLCGIVPIDGSGTSFSMQGTEELTKTQISGPLDALQPGSEKRYSYHLFYGPKKFKMLEGIGFNLEKSVNFGWFDVIAKPALWLLNMFYGFCMNYGVAIILVTILFKALFWPISQKGMKSMKNMQKLQPKMVKIKEKFKDDPAKMNQEVMSLYKTYKVNPLGGCLPMLLQIPVFFALYKVLLQSIELRHAPFMLWISDLSAPDRLWLGFDIPYLGGLPVLTLLMGASMFLQQKLTPTTADPTQAKIMMFLPVIFTFMFLNFASGLVLYWFVNNLLSILQQMIINREKKSPLPA